MIDLDHFKEVNDRYGHNAGDAILRQAANRMRHVLRHDDILCRYGGEEFLLVLPRADAATARAVADRLCDRIGGRAFRLRGSDTALSVTVSVGIAVHRIGAPSAGLEDMQALIGTADDALRQAKVRGRNRIEIARTAIA
jgi:two-component system cell cycle response regulator